jgi:riboflavin synthase
MFSGIVACKVKIKELHPNSGLYRLVLELPLELTHSLRIGASVSVDGTCLTVVRLEGNQVSFDLMQKTIEATAFASLTEGDFVNVERSLKFGDEVGGHVLSGHVDCIGKIINLSPFTGNYLVKIEIPRDYLKYLLVKGYVAVNGVSLTIFEIDQESSAFVVSLIPETLKVTNLASKKVSNLVNIEIDRQTQAIIDTVERVLKDRGISGE